MSISNHIQLANAGDPVTIAWLRWHEENHERQAERFPYPQCNIIASERLYMKSATERICYLCGHKTSHRQTSSISFPPCAKSAWICAQCDS